MLGANDDGVITGIDDDSLQTQLDTLAKDMNNPQLFRPTCYLEFEALKVEGKNVIYGYVPESSQAHMYKGEYYDRNQDGDFVLKGTEQIANLFIRKSKRHTEDEVFPGIGMDDLDPAAFVRLRSLVAAKDDKHEWLAMSNEQILRSGRMLQDNPETGRPGMTLSGVLLFGKEATIAGVLPSYKTDVLCRVRDTELYDDRVQLRCNLFAAYDAIMAFLSKHLSEVPYIENMLRFSLRDKIMREVVLNILVHREYSNAYPASLTIWNDRVETVNWNLPYQYGHITPENLRPHPKNPVIAGVFSQTGLVEELGSGTRKIYKYTPLYSGGREASLEDEDVFRIVVPHPDGTRVETASGVKDDVKDGVKELTEVQGVVFDVLCADTSLTTSQLAQKTGVKFRTVQRYLALFQQKGLIARVGGRKDGHWEVL